MQQTVQELPALVTKHTLSVVSFESCREVAEFPHLSCGVYNIRNFDGTYTQAFCQLNCSNPFQGWRRLAYLDLNSSLASTCPQGFVSRDNPSACIRNSSTPGCSSVIYHNHNLSTYSKVIGRVHVIPYHTPDGYVKFGDDRPNMPTIDQNYVDGVSITYGTPRQHIWTVTFSLTEMANSCSTCILNRPSFFCSHYSCEELVPSNSPFDHTHRQCEGKAEFFYRELPQATMDDLELRVCRDKVRRMKTY